MSLVASVNSLAITAAMVYPGAKSDAAISCRFPITIVTAIVSPNARPNPRITAPTIPDRAYGTTAVQAASHRVAPRPKAASRWLAGTARRTSRDTDMMYGITMIARMIPAASIEFP